MLHALPIYASVHGILVIILVILMISYSPQQHCCMLDLKLRTTSYACTCHVCLLQASRSVLLQNNWEAVKALALDTSPVQPSLPQSPSHDAQSAAQVCRLLKFARP